MLRIILLVLAAVCFAILVFGGSLGSLRLLPLGFLLWVLAEIVPFAWERSRAHQA